MDWLSENWAWVLFLGGFIAIHMFGHGGHGHGDGGRDDDKPPDKDGTQSASKQGPGHQH